MGAGKGGANFLWAIVWLIILIFAGFLVSGFCAGFYILFSIFTPCIKDLSSVTDFLLRGVNFAHYCSENMVSMRPLC
ncbi:unnamed protein product [Larinioides sclopetarius]|uniref:Uncharacterized protein n=1 Tax=Larinioides sclopetarius TaxID=280406 RepID=A0AAV1ZL00_9ARAC